MKAKFICKYIDKYQKDILYLEYEYRGHTYSVYQNISKGNEPLSWQHRYEQDRIDRLIDMEEKQTNQDSKNSVSVEQSINELFEYWEN